MLDFENQSPAFVNHAAMIHPPDLGSCLLSVQGYKAQMGFGLVSAGLFCDIDSCFGFVVVSVTFAFLWLILVYPAGVLTGWITSLEERHNIKMSLMEDLFAMIRMETTFDVDLKLE
ncbi:hypothetical protein U1Q18_044065 [Sarracenia purpurea var. burkii]